MLQRDQQGQCLVDMRVLETKAQLAEVSLLQVWLDSDGAAQGLLAGLVRKKTTLLASPGARISLRM